MMTSPIPPVYLNGSMIMKEKVKQHTFVWFSKSFELSIAVGEAGKLKMLGLFWITFIVQICNTLLLCQLIQLVKIFQAHLPKKVETLKMKYFDKLTSDFWGFRGLGWLLSGFQPIQ